VEAENDIHPGRDMYHEGIALVEAAASQGLTLRLVGGLAVRAHCGRLPFCEREYSDLDVVALRREQAALIRFFKTYGYAEDPGVRIGSAGRQMQFYRPCAHTDGTTGKPLHPDDHVDVYLDRFELDHEIDLRKRLDLDPHTISVSDLLLIKLQTVKLEQKDVRDIVTLLKDVGTGGDSGVDPGYIARLCAADWGLHHDVTINLDRTLAHLGGLDLDDDELGRVESALRGLEAAVSVEPKTRAWRLRARIGERRPWHNEVEEQDGRRIEDRAG
jgi:hypothetical protein